jgi:ubiquitin-conjugating enzyme E2 Q
MADKPSEEELTSILRGEPCPTFPSFYLASALLGFLKDFGRCYKIRTSFDVDWAKADSVGMDEDRSREVFQDGHVPVGRLDPLGEDDDPARKGYELNIPLCAFWWILRRFRDVNKYCLASRSCGLVSHC